MIPDTHTRSDSSAPSSLYAERLDALRAACRTLGLDGYLVPMTDIYQNEYVAPRDRRIKWLTGFSGTAGFVVLLQDSAAFFTDGRYTLQAQAQLPDGLYTLFDVSRKALSEWLGETLHNGMKIGFDPSLHTIKQIERLEAVALASLASLVPVERNLINDLWHDRPAAQSKPFVEHDVAYAGKSASVKRHEIAAQLHQNKLGAVLVTDPASVAWLLNVRGDDVPYTPLPCSTAILTSDGRVAWFMDPDKASPELDQALGPDVSRFAPEDMADIVKKLGQQHTTILVDPLEASYHQLTLLRQAGIEITFSDTPCALPRACKNKTEVEGMRTAHIRDGVAMVSFLHWLEGAIKDGRVQDLTELDVESTLTAHRAKGELYRGPSFATIAASGPNGAIVHYRATPAAHRALDSGSFLLLDSGAQYLDGTTDITRTIALGTPSREMQELFTLVLKGHIALAQACFPEGTSGAELDSFARQFLWQRGLDYSHGTGHGVGSYLCVHEGPQNISRHGSTPLCAGMVTSNEPGFYKAHQFGIRIENLQVVVERPDLSSPDRKMLGFEPLTLVPYDRQALALDLLERQEIDWLNAYHARAYKTLSPRLDADVATWLGHMTTPL